MYTVYMGILERFTAAIIRRMTRDIAGVVMLQPSEPAVYEIAMRDGIMLRTWVYGPGEKGTYPIIFTRSPYNNEFAIYDALFRQVARLGFIVCYQACRGTGGSGGRFEPFINERNDWLDTMRWIKGTLDTSRGIGLYGASYLAFNHIVTADCWPSEVRTAFLAVFGDSLYDVFYRNGALKESFTINWFMQNNGINDVHFLKTGALYSRSKKIIDKSSVLLDLLGVRSKGYDKVITSYLRDGNNNGLDGRNNDLDGSNGDLNDLRYSDDGNNKDLEEYNHVFSGSKKNREGSNDLDGSNDDREECVLKFNGRNIDRDENNRDIKRRSYDQNENNSGVNGNSHNRICNNKDRYGSGHDWDLVNHGLKHINVPVCLVGGFYDFAAAGQMRLFEGLRPNVKADSRLILGPWNHMLSAYGDYRTPKANEGGIQGIKYALEWFIRHFYKNSDDKAVIAPGSECVREEIGSLIPKNNNINNIVGDDSPADYGNLAYKCEANISARADTDKNNGDNPGIAHGSECVQEKTASIRPDKNDSTNNYIKDGSSVENGNQSDNNAANFPAHADTETNGAPDLCIMKNFRYYSIGEGFIESDGIPATDSERMYLNDGVLTSEAGEGWDTYIFNPARPSMTAGGGATFPDMIPLTGRPKQWTAKQAVPFRKDTLTYISDIFSENVRFFGSFVISLDVESDCPDTMFYAKLCLLEDGGEYHMCDGVTTLFSAAGGVVLEGRRTIRFETSPIAFRVKPGACLTLRVTSSDYPAYSVHTNESTDYLHSKIRRKARNTVYYGENSYIELRYII